MVVQTNIDEFSHQRIYPGRGLRFVSKDGKTHIFISRKTKCMSLNKVKPQKIQWTFSWRKDNKKIKTDDQVKLKKKKVVKAQKAIIGITLNEIQKKKQENPDQRKIQATKIALDIKEKKQKQLDQRKKEYAKIQPKVEKVQKKKAGKR